VLPSTAIDAGVFTTTKSHELEISTAVPERVPDITIPVVACHAELAELVRDASMVVRIYLLVLVGWYC